MGVLPCSRGDCENIMCDRYSHEYGYICHECFDELCTKNPPSIKQFMSSDKVAEKPRVDYGAVFPMQDMGTR